MRAKSVLCIQFISIELFCSHLDKSIVENGLENPKLCIWD